MNTRVPPVERGFSLVETLVVMVVGLILTGAAITLVARTKQASDAGQPVVERTRTRAAALAEMVTGIRDAAAKTAYFDLASTVASVTFGAGGGGPSGPPEGYCLLVKTDPSTWPPGFDPDDRTTWDDVPWWEGFDREEPSTWYYDCSQSGGGDPKKTAARVPGGGGGGTKPPDPTPPGSIPHQFDLAPVASYGTGVVVSSKLKLVGPVAVLAEETGLGGAQDGQALLVLRTEPGVGQFRLAAPLVTTSGVIRLVGRASGERGAIEGLLPGDILMVTGRDSAGAVRTSLVALTAAPRPVGASTVARADGSPVFQTFEARIAPPGETYLGYLANSEATSAGAEYLVDAAVALLGREGAVVSYYTAKGEEGLGLYRAVGDPTKPASVERLVEGAAEGLVVESRPGGDPAFVRPITGVRIRVPVAAGDGTTDAEPLEADVALLNTVEGRPAAHLVWDAIELPEDGSGDGGAR